VFVVGAETDIAARATFLIKCRCGRHLPAEALAVKREALAQQ
jgi:hypothetical protein